jgi:hypothetical protein
MYDDRLFGFVGIPYAAEKPFYLSKLKFAPRGRMPAGLKNARVSDHAMNLT